MSKVIALPKRKKKPKLIYLDSVRQKNVFDIVEHRRKLLKLQNELSRIKRALLRLVKNDESEPV